MKPGAGEYEVHDTLADGLLLRVGPGSTKSWTLYYHRDVRNSDDSPRSNGTRSRAGAWALEVRDVRRTAASGMAETASYETPRQVNPSIAGSFPGAASCSACHFLKYDSRISFGNPWA